MDFDKNPTYATCEMLCDMKRMTQKICSDLTVIKNDLSYIKTKIIKIDAKLMHDKENQDNECLLDPYCFS